MTTTNRPAAHCDHCPQQYFGKDASLELAIHVDRRHTAPRHIAVIGTQRISFNCAVGHDHTIVTDR